MKSISSVVLNSKSMEFEFPGFEDFKVTIRYNTTEKLAELRSQCVKNVIDTGTGFPMEKLDREKWDRIFTENTIESWTGLTWGILAELMLIDESAVNKEEEVDFSIDNAVALLQGSKSFDVWLNANLKDINNFRK
ncbi:hypothetical protein [Vibrio phage VCPH]|nr:hypothetical protein [Vibrio phage VCPH]